jgi:hypothetical protein
MSVAASHPLSIERTLQQLREIRTLLEPRRSVERDRHRAEDRIREEHHDAHATTIRASSVVGGDNSADAEPSGRSRKPPSRMRIRIIKTPPAPLMDGFDVRGIRGNHTYEVDSRTGAYLVIAGYAVRDE